MASTIRWLFAAVSVIAAVISVSASARADHATGDELYADCTAPAGENARLGFCQGYIAAIADVARQSSQVPTLGVLGEVECADKDVPLKQMFDEVTRSRSTPRDAPPCGRFAGRRSPRPGLPVQMTLWGACAVSGGGDARC